MDSWVIYTITLLIIFGGTIYYATYLRSFKIIVLVRDMTSGKSIVRMDKAREIIDKDGVCRWHLLKEKVKLDRPPHHYVDVTPKGKKFVECAKYADLTYKWAELSPKFADEQYTIQHKLSEDDKQSYFNMYRRSMEERANTLEKLIQQFLPYIVIGIIFIGGFFIFNNIGEQTNKALAQVAGMQAQQLELQKSQETTMLLIRDILQNRATYFPVFNTTEAPN